MCTFIDDLFDYQCMTELPPDPYTDFGPFRDIFLTYFIKDNEPVVTLPIAIDSQGRKMAQIIGKPPNISMNKQQIILLHLNIGPYGIYHTSDIKEQTEDLLRNGYLHEHATVLLINPIERTAEYFEPNGNSVPWNDTVLHLLQQFLSSQGITLTIPYNLYCPFGPQMIAGDQRCGNWSLLYAVLRIRCPDLTGSEITDILTSFTSDQLLRLMDNWTCWLWDYIRFNRIEEAYTTYWYYEPMLDEETAEAVHTELYTLYDIESALTLLHNALQRT